MKVWEKLKHSVNCKGQSEYTPLWHNSKLSEIQKIGKIKEWDNRGINRLIQLYKGNILKSFEELKEEFGISSKSYFCIHTG